MFNFEAPVWLWRQQQLFDTLDAGYLDTGLDFLLHLHPAGRTSAHVIDLGSLRMTL